MKNKPVVINELNIRHTNFELRLEFKYNITFLLGDSGQGKSAIYSFINEYAANDSRIRCFNYTNLKMNYKNSIQNMSNKLIIIDNADILLNTPTIREYIAFDEKNQYLIIGRNPEKLMLMKENFYELKSKKKWRH